MDKKMREFHEKKAKHVFPVWDKFLSKEEDEEEGFGGDAMKTPPRYQPDLDQDLRCRGLRPAGEQGGRLVPCGAPAQQNGFCSICGPLFPRPVSLRLP